jgi:hypothetical protein
MGANGSTAEVRGYQPNKAAALGWTADVVINASGAGGWFDHTQATSAYGDFGSNIFNAKTIIHELGHVFETLFGSDSTRIVNDATSNAISFTNSDRVMTDCFGWKRP